MKFEDIKEFYHRRLPHYQVIGATFFVTFRLHGSIPKVELDRLRLRYEDLKSAVSNRNPPDLKEQLDVLNRKYFGAYDRLLDQIKTGPHYLKDETIARVVKDQLHRFDGEWYDLVCYCIMSNHVHVILKTDLQIPEDIHPVDWRGYEFTPLNKILGRIKGASAYECNRLLGRTGHKFWQPESWDRIPRSPEQLQRMISYVLNNPVKAGIVTDWELFPHTYLKGWEATAR